MRRPNLAQLTFFILLIFASTEAFGQLSAHFKTTDLDYDSTVGDCDICFLCTPTCELYFEFGVFSSTGQEGDLALHPGACNYQEHEHGVWNYPDQEISRQIPNMSSGARFYFALFDQDPADSDDLLGTHTEYHSGPWSGNPIWNNTTLPTGYTSEACDGGAIDNDNASRRFNFRHSVWFTDASTPNVSAPFHTESHGGTVGTGWDNDETLHFSWSRAIDVHSGVTQVGYELRKDEVVIHSGSDAPTADSTSICSSGCRITHEVAEGSKYEFRVRARNGASIQLQNPAFSNWSGWSDPVMVDSTGDSITSIAAYTEQGGDAILPGQAQADNSPYLEWQVTSSVSPIVGYSYSITGTPSCDVMTNVASTTLSGLKIGTTIFRVRAIDEAANCGPETSFAIEVLLPEDIFKDGFEEIEVPLEMEQESG